jgi:malate/lactate dehydrogenase
MEVTHHISRFTHHLNRKTKSSVNEVNTYVYNIHGKSEYPQAP